MSKYRINYLNEIHNTSVVSFSDVSSLLLLLSFMLCNAHLHWWALNRGSAYAGLQSKRGSASNIK